MYYATLLELSRKSQVSSWILQWKTVELPHPAFRPIQIASKAVIAENQEQRATAKMGTKVTQDAPCSNIYYP